MVEDRSLEALELIVRLEPELLGQQPPARAVDLERVRLAAAAVEREHQLAPQTLAQRMLGDAGLELGDDRAVASELDGRLESPLDGLETKLLEAPDLALGEVHERELGEGRAAPEGQCLLERPQRRLRIVLQRAPRLRSKRRESVGVDRARRDTQDIARSLGDDRSVRAEHTSQVGDIPLDGLHGGTRCRVAPERLNQRVDGDNLTPPEHKSGKECALAPRGQPHLSA